MNNSFCYLDGVKIIGTTLWANISQHASRFINDFFVIRTSSCEYLTCETYRKWHKEAVTFIEQEINKDDIPTIVLTHHAVNPQMNGIYVGNELESAFSTDLSHLCKYPVKCFLSGHTHQNIEIVVNNMLIKANCYGYYGNESNYCNNKIITI